jgi:hypothetical protein
MKFRCFYGGFHKDCLVLGYDTVLSGRNLPTFFFNIEDAGSKSFRKQRYTLPSYRRPYPRRVTRKRMQIQLMKIMAKQTLFNSYSED